MEQWRDAVTGEAKHLGVLWRLEMNGRAATCLLFGDPLGLEVRLEIEGRLCRAGSFGTAKEMLDASELWRLELAAEGWLSGGSST